MSVSQVSSPVAFVDGVTALNQTNFNQLVFNSGGLIDTVQRLANLQVVTITDASPANTNLVANQDVLVVWNNTVAKAVTLPARSTQQVNKMIRFYRANNSYVACTINRSGSDNIVQPDLTTASTFVQQSPGSNVILFNDGTNWSGQYSTPRVSFRARRTAAQTIPVTTWTKISYNIVTPGTDWNIGNYYDNVTNFRFQPLIAGYYFINQSLIVNSGAAANVLLAIYKNGALFDAQSTYPQNGTTSAIRTAHGMVIFMNGSTDFLEGFAFLETNTRNVLASTFENVFTGTLLFR